MAIPLTVNAVGKFLQDTSKLSSSWNLQRGTTLLLMKTGGRKDARCGTYYIRHGSGKQEVRLPIGSTKVMTPELARDAAVTLIQRAHSEDVDLDSYLRSVKGRNKIHQDYAARDTIDKYPLASFGHLLLYYEESVKAEGRDKDNSISGCLNASVRKFNRDLLMLPAKDITSKDILAIMQARIDQGVTAQVNKLHTYLQAAFNRALVGDKLDPRIHKTQRQMADLFALKDNPVSKVSKVKEFDCARDRFLSRKELRHLLRIRRQLPPQHVGFVYLTLFSCVRPFQIVRVPWDHYDLEAKTMLSKKEWIKQKQFDHVNPIIPALESELERLRPHSGHLMYPCVKSDRNGNLYDEHLDKDGFSYRLNKYIIDAVDEDGEPLWPFEPFQTRDLRETISYHMSEELEIDDETIRRLQVHALGQGVTTVNYGRYRKMKAKQRAMNEWQDYLEELAGEPLTPSQILTPPSTS